MDIRACTVPPENVALRVSYRHRAGTEPAILRIRSTQPVVALITLTRLHALHPAREALLLVVGMYVVQPTKSDAGLRRRACVFVKTGAYVISGSIGISAKDNVWRRLNDCVQLLMLLGQFCIELFQRQRFVLELFRSFGNSLLEFSIQAFQLLVLPMQFRKHLHFSAQN